MEQKQKLLNKRSFLYATEFFSGMAVMAAELGASRLLAPYFSSSQIVWTIIIGTIMIAMALGNVLGGRQADRDPSPDRVFRRILLSGLWLGAVPVLGKYLILAVTGLLALIISHNLLIWAAFLSCLILFVFPLFLLGTVTPSLIRISCQSLDESGRIAGLLGGLNTIGSIIGTFVPTFLTIPAFGTAATFLIFSGILIFLSLLYFGLRGGKKRLIFVSLLLYGLCLLFGHRSSFAFWAKDLTYEGESVYNYLQVYEQAGATCLSTNVLFGVQSVKMHDQVLTGMYYDYALCAHLMAGLPEMENPSCLILGNGTGTFAGASKAFFPSLSLTGVEIDEKITDLAGRYFGLDGDIPVVTEDARAFLSADTGKYDVIFVDAYQDITIPFQMSSTEFFTLAKEHLKENGILAVNLNMISREETVLTDALTSTIGSVFPSLLLLDVPGSFNRLVFAGVEDRLFERFHASLSSLSPGPFRELMARAEGAFFSFEGEGTILTDDRAPVELLGMRLIDSLIRDELSYYREQFAKGGLSLFLSSL